MLINYHSFADANLIPNDPQSVFVFGSNTLGIHGAGLARVAVKRFGALSGKPKGLQGQSYAIITKDLGKPVHPSVTAPAIVDQIKLLYEYAKKRPLLRFYIPYTKGGTNRSGYSAEEIFEMFTKNIEVPTNILFHESYNEN